MSGRKNALPKFQNITAADMSANFTSVISSIEFTDNICIELICTGTPTGQFFVEASSDYSQDGFGNVTNAGNWGALNLSTTLVISGSATNFFGDCNQLSWPWIRVRYAATSGSGTCNGFIGGKMI